MKQPENTTFEMDHFTIIHHAVMVRLKRGGTADFIAMLMIMIIELVPYLQTNPDIRKAVRQVLNKIRSSTPLSR